jgi:sulfoxide reductase heme-binding subunit YedZ
MGTKRRFPDLERDFVADSDSARRGGILNNVYLFWLILAIPALYIIWGRLTGAKMPYLYWTGLISCILLALTLAITPVMLILRRPLPWLKKRRRYLGVASFGYAALHTLLWLVNANWGKLIGSFTRVDLVAGWAATGIMVLLAITSFDRAVDSLGPRWKQLQRWVYPAAALTLAHWLLTGDNPRTALMWSLPVIALEAWRVLRYRRRQAAG